MAVDFPNSPTLNQTFTVGATTWIYDGSKWKILTSGTGALVNISDTAPSNPTAGMFWYDSTTGKTYVYYDEFWVEYGESAQLAIPGHASNHVRGGVDIADGDRLQVDYSPTRYTSNSAAAGAGASTDLTAHLSGIDTLAGQGHMILTTTQRDALTGVATGTCIFNSTIGVMQQWNGSEWIMAEATPARLTATQRDALTNVTTGTRIFNTTIGVMQQWNGSAWIMAEATPPRLTTTVKNALTNLTAGTMVYDTTLGLMQVYTGSAWVPVTQYVPIRSTTFSAVASAPLDGVFTSAFTNYRVVWTVTATSAALTTSPIRFALRAAGVNYSAADSGWGGFYNNGTTVTGTTGAGNNTVNVGVVTMTTGTCASTGTFDIFSPAVAGAVKTGNCQSGSWIPGTNVGINYTGQFGFGTTAGSWDGFFISSAGASNITGTITVYGIARP